MRTETEQMLVGKPYDPAAPELIADRKHASDLARRYNATTPSESGRREALLRELFGDVGDDCFANDGCVLLDSNTIEFGDRCLLGPGVHVYTPTHPIDPTERATGRERALSVTVGDDVWIGGRAELNPGVTVGDETVVASGAVVTDDVPKRVVVGGNPARVIREIE